MSFRITERRRPKLSELEVIRTGLLVGSESRSTETKRASFLEPVDTRRIGSQLAVTREQLTFASRNNRNQTQYAIPELDAPTISAQRRANFILHGKYDIVTHPDGKMTIESKPRKKGGAGFWEDRFMELVNFTNGGSPFDKIDIRSDKVTMDHLETVVRVAMRSVYRPKNEPYWPKSNLPGLVVNIIGTLPMGLGTHVVFDWIPTAAAAIQTARGLDTGKFLPYAAMTGSDLSVVGKYILLTPGSVLNVRRAAYQYTNMQTQFLGERMRDGLVKFAGSEDLTVLGRDDAYNGVVYGKLADRVLANRGGEVKKLTRTIEDMTKQVLAAEGLSTKLPKTEQFQFLTIDQLERHFSPQDQIRYILGQNLIEAFNMAKATKGQRDDLSRQARSRIV